MNTTPDPEATRLLVVEDEMIIAHALSAILEDCGYEVVGIAGTSAAALELADGCDLVLMDINLRGDTDGIETAKILRERGGAPVVFLTAFSDEATIDRARVAEPYGFLRKPIDERDLKPTLEMALHKHKMEVERAELTKRLQAALAEVQMLRAFLPICAWCKKVRDDDGGWAELEEFVEKRLQAVYTHSMCPDCSRDQIRLAQE